MQYVGYDDYVGDDDDYDELEFGAGEDSLDEPEFGAWEGSLALQGDQYVDQYGQSVTALPQKAPWWTYIPWTVPIVGMGALGGSWLGGMAAEAGDMDPWMGRLVGGGLGAVGGWFARAPVTTAITTPFRGDDAYGAVSYSKAKGKWKEWKRKLKKHEKNKFKSGPLSGKVKDPFGRQIAKDKVKEWRKKMDGAADKPKPKPKPQKQPTPPVTGGPTLETDWRTHMADLTSGGMPTDLGSWGTGTATAPTQLSNGQVASAARGGPPEEQGVMAWFSAPMWEEGPSRTIIIGSTTGLLVAGGLAWWFLAGDGEAALGEDYQDALG